MAQTLRELMTQNVVTLPPTAPLPDAARRRVDRAVQLMRERAVRRLPVAEGGSPLGIVSIGDLAIELDEHSGLADVNAAESNN